MGEVVAQRAEEISAIHRALDLGITHLDTAEMYGEGRTEELLGEALSGRRDGVFLTSKVYPWNSGRSDMIAACEGSLARLRTDVIDLYLLHWPGSVAFAETLEAADALKQSGKIRAFGVSNFDMRGIDRMVAAGFDGPVDVNQVMYNPARRGIEFDLLPRLSDLSISTVAYTPIEPGRLAQCQPFSALAEEAGLTAPELALAWHMTRGAAVPIPKAGRVAHADALVRAASVRLDTAQMAEIDRIFPPPDRAVGLDIL